MNAQYVMGPGDLGLEGGDLATGNLHLDGREGPATAQSWMAYWRVRKIIEDAGASMDDILYEKTCANLMARDGDRAQIE